MSSVYELYIAQFPGRFPTRKRFELSKSYVCFGIAAMCPVLFCSRMVAIPLSSLLTPSHACRGDGRRYYLPSPTNVHPIRSSTPADDDSPSERAPFRGLWCVQMIVHREITRGCAQLHDYIECKTFDRPMPIRPMTLHATYDNDSRWFNLYSPAMRCQRGVWLLAFGAVCYWRDTIQATDLFSKIIAHYKSINRIQL